MVFDLPGLRQRAEDLRHRLAEFIKGFGPESAPEFRQLHDELAEIDRELEDLAEQPPDEEARV